MFFIIEADDFLYSINHHFTCLKQRHIYILFLSYYDIFLFSACVQVHISIFCRFFMYFYIKYILLYSFNQSTIICTLSFFYFANILLLLFILQYFLLQSTFYCTYHLYFNHFCSRFIIMVRSSQKQTLPSLYFILTLISPIKSTLFSALLAVFFI